MAPLCRAFGISRVTGYKIFNRCKECGLGGFIPQEYRNWSEKDQARNRLEF